VSNRLHKAALVFAAALLLAGAGLMQRALNRQRSDLGLTRVAPLENAPPVLAFTTVALGGFRGLIANALWIRANDLQQEDRFFEQVQLADWISKLEPTFVQVWVVQAWNMAYNISVKFRDPYDRWRWVQRGIELLRDEGLKYNPREALIYRELAWFFQHKMGQNLDDAHLVYKYEWAKEMTRVLGGGRPNYDDLLNPRTDEARQRVQQLREKLKMEPALMKKADDLYGPLEWRLPEASAIYWAMVGLENSSKKDLITLRRVIYQSLQMSVMRGRILLVRPDDSLVFGPDLSKIGAANDGYEKMLAEEAEKPEVVQRAHRNFLKEAIFMLYMHNRTAEANRWMTVLKQKYPGAVPNQVSVEQYALERLAGTATEVHHDKTKALIEGLLTQHFENLAIDNDDRAEGVLRMARQIWNYYDSSIQMRKEPLKLDPFEEMYTRIRDQVLDPKTGMLTEYTARLRTRLGLPAAAAVAPKTNGAPTAPKQP
jgi:hypothetical protein